MASSTNICATIDCGKPANMRCPTCKKLGIPGGYFCSQECFKSFWPSHKVFHKRFKAAAAEAMKKYEENAADSRSFKTLPSDFDGFPFSGPLRPGTVSPQMTVSDDIEKPDYAIDSLPHGELAMRGSAKIHINSEEEIKIMREAGRLAREVMDAARETVRVGATGEEVDKTVYNACMERKVYPSPLNYHGFPKSVCISVNEVICHGIPDDRKFEDGDIVNLDVTIYYKGHHADLNETFLVGNVSEKHRKLVRNAYECLSETVPMIKPGTMYRSLGAVVSKISQRDGYSSVRNFCGHGVNQLFHTTPNVPHYAKNKAVGIMREGHTFTIEPMINEGVSREIMWPDDWTATTADGKRSAQFEHTFLVTAEGVEILTARAGAPRDRLVWDEEYLQR